MNYVITLILRSIFCLFIVEGLAIIILIVDALIFDFIENKAKILLIIFIIMMLTGFVGMLLTTPLMK